MAERKHNMKEGFSLVELIITIAILVVFVGGATLSISLLRSADSQGLASGINGALTELKASSESKRGPIQLFIYKFKDEGYYSHFVSADEYGVIPTPSSFSVPTDTPGDDVKLGSASLKVMYEDGTADGTEIKGDKFAVIQMQKKDGAYVDVNDYTVAEDGERTETLFMSTPKYFEIWNGDELKYKVVLAKETGLHYTEQQE